MINSMIIIPRRSYPACLSLWGNLVTWNNAAGKSPGLRTMSLLELKIIILYSICIVSTGVSPS